MCGKCKDWHHDLIMCPKFAPTSKVVLEEVEKRGKVSVNAMNSGGTRNPIQMLAKEIEIGNGGMKPNAFWDSGAQLTMVTHAKAMGCGLRRCQAPPLEVLAFDGGATLVDTRYHIPLVTVDREHHAMFAYGVDEIARDLQHSLTNSSVVSDFPEVSWEQVKGLSGPVDMLIGMDNCREVLEKVGGLVEFKIWHEWMLAGTAVAGCACHEYGCVPPAMTACAVAVMFRHLDFISA